MGQPAPPSAQAGPLDRPAVEGAMEVPERSSRFRILGELGRGGMGAVEKAVDTVSGREFALKRLLVSQRPDAANRKRIALFEREYHTLSQLRHPRIIEVFDYGVDELGPYYTMELLDGRDLSERMPVGWREMCRIGRDVASSLSILHARGIVHRDVTPGNIRCGDNGYAKLIDFGAMTPMGAAKETVGTAPFVAPEALQAGVLDGRADLFALGVTLYLSVSGRLPYAGRKLSQLLDAWRSPVTPLKALRPEIPDGFDALVMELLSLSPLGRPQHAGLVFDRLSAVGELSRDEALEVAGAYLSVPTLTGRTELLGRCRASLVKARHGRGRSLLVSSARGLGRSRLLDAIALEAKLLGAIVLRADSADAGEYGVVRQLSKGLLMARPQAQPTEATLTSLIAGTPHSCSRDRLVATLNTWLLECAAKWPIAVIVDDVHAVDEPSLAALGALASEPHKHALLVVCSTADDAPCRSPAALALLAESSHPMPLLPLTEAETRSLLASMFSDADNLDVLSAVLFDHGRGNPALTLEGAQALVDAAQLRYASGAWSIPTEAQALRAALPKDAGLAARFSKLSDDARALALVVALDAHDAIGTPDYAGLLDRSDAQNVHGVVRELARAHILTPGDLRCSLAYGGYREEIQACASPADQSAAHRRLASWFEAIDRPLAAAHHYTCAGDWESALALVAESCLGSETGDVALFEPTMVETIERLLAHCDALESAPPCLLALRCRFMKLCAERDEWARLLPHVRPALAGLEDRCGLSDYAALDELPAAERLSATVARAKARHADGAGGLSLVEALTELPGVAMTGATAAILALDLELAERLPSLVPLFPLSPAFALVERLCGGIVACCHGHIDRALDMIRGVHTELGAGDIAGLSETSQHLLLRFALGFVQAIEASMGRPEVLERAAPSTGRSPKIMARERYAYYVAIGDMEQATAARRRLERLEVAGGAQRTFPTSWETEYSNYALTDNLQGLKRCERQAMQVAEQMPNWAVRVELARVAQALCGASTEATLERAMALRARTVWGTSDGRYALFLCFEALLGLDRNEECRVLAQECVDRLGRPCDWFDAYEVFLARAEARLGMHEAARARAERYRDMYLASGVRGVLVGATYEGVARVALWTGDVALFRSSAELCAAEYRCGYNPALTARYERLIREAKAHQVSITDEVAQAAAFPERDPVSELVEAFSTHLSTCLDAGDRLRTVLALAVERSGATGGLLYVARSEGLRRVASQGFDRDPASLDLETESYWRAETEDSDLETETGFLTAEASALDSAINHGGQRLTPVLLCDGGKPAPCGCGVLVLAAPQDGALRHDQHVTAALTLLILQDEDVVRQPLV